MMAPEPNEVKGRWRGVRRSKNCSPIERARAMLPRRSLTQIATRCADLVAFRITAVTAFGSDVFDSL